MTKSKITSSVLDDIRKSNSSYFTSLQNAYEQDIITLSEVQNKTNMRKEEIIKKHNDNYHRIWRAKDGRWKTKLPNGDKEKLVAKTKLEDLEDAIVEFYKEQEEPEIISIRSMYPVFLEQKKLEKVADTTYVRYQNTWDKYLENDTELVNQDITKLKKGYCKTWTLQFLNDNPMKRKCYSGVKSLITQILEVATDKDLVIGNVYRDIRIPTNCFLEDDTTDDEQVFTDDEIALLTDYLWKRYEEDRTYTAPLAILFTFVTGVRAGELCAMKFSDMIEDGKFIQIKRQRVKKLNQNGELKEYTFVEHAKARSRKKPLYIPTDGQKILSLVKESNELNGDSAGGFIFYNRHSYMTTATLDRLMETACRQVGIPVRRMHCIRKTYSTRLTESGINIPILSTAMGHANIETTLRYYVKNRTTCDQQENTIEPVLGKSVTHCNPVSA